MIEKFGIGIDVVNVDRFSSKFFFDNIEFYKKIFTQNEIDYCNKFKDPYTHFAGKFALKEAVIKALNDKLDFLEIEIFYQNNSPYVKLAKYPNQISKSSISHENNVAIAVFLIEIPFT